MDTKSIRQSTLTEECWGVQMWGLDSCKTCEYVDSEECGGKRIRATGKNKKGFDVPLGGELNEV